MSAGRLAGHSARSTAAGLRRALSCPDGSAMAFAASTAAGTVARTNSIGVMATVGRPAAAANCSQAQ